MARIAWTPQALDDLNSITSYIARDSPRAAEALHDEVYEAVGWLDLFPRAGRMVPEYNQEDIREIFVRGYRVIYRVLPDHVEVLMVYHGRRRLGPSDFPH